MFKIGLGEVQTVHIGDTIPSSLHFSNKSSFSCSIKLENSSVIIVVKQVTLIGVYSSYSMPTFQFPFLKRTCGMPAVSLTL